MVVELRKALGFALELSLLTITTEVLPRASESTQGLSAWPYTLEVAREDHY
jgi:hypothetical protein